MTHFLYEVKDNTLKLTPNDFVTELNSILLLLDTFIEDPKIKELTKNAKSIFDKIFQRKHNEILNLTNLNFEEFRYHLKKRICDYLQIDRTEKQKNMEYLKRKYDVVLEKYTRISASEQRMKKVVIQDTEKLLAHKKQIESIHQTSQETCKSFLLHKHCLNMTETFRFELISKIKYFQKNITFKELKTFELWLDSYLTWFQENNTEEQNEYMREIVSVFPTPTSLYSSLIEFIIWNTSKSEEPMVLKLEDFRFVAYNWIKNIDREIEKYTERNRNIATAPETLHKLEMDIKVSQSDFHKLQILLASETEAFEKKHNLTVKYGVKLEHLREWQKNVKLINTLFSRVSLDYTLKINLFLQNARTILKDNLKSCESYLQSFSNTEAPEVQLITLISSLLNTLIVRISRLVMKYRIHHYINFDVPGSEGIGVRFQNLKKLSLDKAIELTDERH